MQLLPILHRKQQQQAGGVPLSDCLAACAAMLLDYLQVSVKYKEYVPHGVRELDFMFVVGALAPSFVIKVAFFKTNRA